MMAETVVYSREYLFIKEMYKKGELGKIQHLAASHPQDMDGWPAYWEKMIPMHYATHVVSPCLGLVDGSPNTSAASAAGPFATTSQRSPATSLLWKPATSRSKTPT
jgi:predicted dehydrogenase